MDRLLPTPEHFINIGPKGTFAPSGKYHTTPEQVDDLFDQLRKESTDHLVLYFHGGLVSETAGMATAAHIQSVFSSTSCHPISLVWQTGFFETIRTRLQSVVHTRIFQKLLFYVLKVVGDKIGLQDFGGKGISNLTDQQIDDELQQEDPFASFEQVGGGKGMGFRSNMSTQDLKEEIEASVIQELESDLDNFFSAAIQAEALNTPLLDRDKIADEPLSGGKGIFVPTALIKSLVTVSFQAIKRRHENTDHGFFTTVVEEILREFYLADFGAWVWGGMKQQAEDMWSPNDSLANLQLHAGSYLLEKLNLLKAERPSLTIDLIGHSAGSIVACNLLRVTATRYPQLRFRHILFLAPACTVDLFVDEVVSRQNRFESFRMFTMYDATEQADRLVKGLYNRSLLYFISGVLEQEADKPIAGLHRHLQGRAPYNQGKAKLANNFLQELGYNRLVLSKTELGVADGLQCDSISHGAFDEDQLTLASIIHILG